MITTVNVSIGWGGSGSPKLSNNPQDRLSIRDPRVLLGVQQVLAKRTGVTQAPDLVSANATPYFVMSLEDTPPDMFGSRTAITTLLDWLTDPIKFSVAFAADGGWKSVPVDIAVEVI